MWNNDWWTEHCVISEGEGTHHIVCDSLPFISRHERSILCRHLQEQSIEWNHETDRKSNNYGLSTNKERINRVYEFSGRGSYRDLLYVFLVHSPLVDSCLYGTRSGRLSLLIHKNILSDGTSCQVTNTNSSWNKLMSMNRIQSKSSHNALTYRRSLTWERFICIAVADFIWRICDLKIIFVFSRRKLGQRLRLYEVCLHSYLDFGIKWNKWNSFHRLNKLKFVVEIFCL